MSRVTRIFNVIKKSYRHVILIPVAFLFNLPIVWTVLSSLKPGNKVTSIPTTFIFQPTIESYRRIYDGVFSAHFDIWLHIKNSLIISLTTAILIVLFGALAAYSFVRFKFHGRRTLGTAVILTRLVPPIAAMVPLYLFVQRIGMLDTHFSIIMAYLAIQLPFAIWLLMGFLEGIPYDLEQAAMIDGCSLFGVMRHVTLPLLSPGLLTVFLLNFITSWNEFEVALTLTSRQSVTAPLMVMSLMTPSEAEMMWGPVTALGVLLLLPPLVIAILAHKYLIQGLTAGGIKG